MTPDRRDGPAEHGAAAGRDRLDPATEGAARHGIAAPRGQAARGGRFGRLFPFLEACDPGDAALEELAMLLEPLALDKHNDRLPAGFTYLGQFVDHDITFDPTSRLHRDNDPRALVNFRTPRFDLDSLYGSGPADQPFLYDWRPGTYPGVKLLVGHNPCPERFTSEDLPRNEQGRALTGDARNDENLIVSQLHLLFMKFHNAVVERLADARTWPTPARLFEEAQRIVRWHYQWIVMHDFLDRIVGNDATPVVARLAWQDGRSIPIEFSGAAFRFGHSMVRDTYELNATLSNVPIFAPANAGPDAPHLGGFRRLPAGHAIDWKLFFFKGEWEHVKYGEAVSPPADKANFSFKLNHVVSQPLHHLPPDNASLPLLNMQRGVALELPSGGDVAAAMGVARPLKQAELFTRAPLSPSPATADALLRATPLWFYILREASVRKAGLSLGPVGGQIVSDVLHGLLEGDPRSYLRRSPQWAPTLGPELGGFTMLDLLGFTNGEVQPAALGIADAPA